MAKTIYEMKPVALWRVIRPIHWVKNLSLFAALVFSGNLLDQSQFLQVFWAFLAFNLAASATYVFNDTLDAERDRLHPIKQKRPIAAGIISRTEGLFIATAFAGVAVLWAYTLSYIFFILLVAYLVMQVLYSIYLKRIYIVDILIIATGFVMRVYAGAFVINAHLSVWFLLCVISFALFLASGKRRAELSVVESPSSTRKSLQKYPIELLNSYVTMFGSAAWLSWALFTFFESPQISESLFIFLAGLSKTASINKLLMITIPFTIFGVMRYQSLIFEDRTEAPERVLLTDVALISSVGMWLLLVVWILYGGGGIY